MALGTLSTGFARAAVIVVFALGAGACQTSEAPVDSSAPALATPALTPNETAAPEPATSEPATSEPATPEPAGQATTPEPTEEQASTVRASNGTDGTCEVSENAVQFQPVTIDCAGPQAAESKATSLDLRFDVIISHEDHDDQTWVVPGYFAADGDAANSGATEGDVWRAHFNPPAAGGYSYRVAMRRGDGIAIADEPTGSSAAGDGATGSFMVVDADTNSAGFNRTGKLTYAGTAYPRFANGEWFVKGGPGSPETFLGMGNDFDATPGGNGQLSLNNFVAHLGDWNEGDPAWNNGGGDARGQGIIGAVNYIADVAAMNSMYMITMAEGGDGNNVFPWPGRVADDIDNLFTYDVSKLDQWRIVFEHMYDQGVHAHLLTTETETEQFFEWHELGTTGGTAFADSRKLYYRELIARFGHLNLTWDIGEEFGGVNNAGHGYPEEQGFPGSIEQVGLYADFFESVDPYQTPVVVHTRNNETEQYSALYGRASFDGIAIQSNEANAAPTTARLVTESAAAGHPWIVSSDEQAPANAANPCNQNAAELQAERADVLWGNLMNGGWGTEWYGGYGTCGNDFTHGNFRDRDEQYRQTGHAIGFFTTHFAQSLDSLQPAPELLADAAGGTVLAGVSRYVIYLRSATTTGSLRVGDDDGDYTLRWFNPRTGDYGDPIAATGPAVVLGDPPAESSMDWVVLVEAGECIGCPAVVASPSDLSDQADPSVPSTETLEAIMFDQVGFDLGFASASFGPGEYDADALGALNDDIESIQVPAGLQVTLCQDSGGYGVCQVFDRDVDRLPPALKDRASYLLVEAVS